MNYSIDPDWFLNGVLKLFSQAFPSLNFTSRSAGCFEASITRPCDEEVVRIEIKVFDETIYIYVFLEQAYSPIGFACESFSWGGEPGNDFHLKEFTENGPIHLLKGILSGSKRLVVLRRSSWWGFGKDQLSLEIEGARFHSSVVKVCSWSKL